MKSIFLVALANIRRRKKQNLLVGLSIFLSVLLLTTAIGVLSGISKPFDTMFDRLKASHILLYYDQLENDGQKINEWFSKQPEVEFAGKAHPFLMITEPLIYHDEKVDIMVRLTEYAKSQESFDQLLKQEGGSEKIPGWGEVWIPKHLSGKYGIAVGDTLQVPLTNGLYPLIVSAIVIDPHYASGLINPNRLWIAPGMLSFVVPVGKMNEEMQGIRLKDKNDIDKVWARFNHEVNYIGSNLQYSLFKSVFTSVYKIIGLVIIVFSVLAIIISAYIISTLIISSVLADSRLTGILKALGFKPNQIIHIYLIQYLLLMLFFIPTGLLASHFSVKMILKSILKSIGLVNFSFQFWPVFLFSSLFFILLIIFLVWFYSKKAGKVVPANALRSVSGEVNLSRSGRSLKIGMDRMPMSLWVALKLIIDNPKKSFFSMISLALTVFIFGFSVNISNSFSKITDHKSAWGFDNSDLQITRAKDVILPLEHSSLVDQLKDEEWIAEIIPFSYYELVVPSSNESAPSTLNGKVFEGSPSKAGLVNLSGAHPVGENEISLCVETAKKLSAVVGDSVTMLMENEPKRFFVSGIYQDISNLGEGFRLDETAVQSVNPLFKPDRYALIVTDKTRVDELKTALLKKYGEAIKIELTIDEQLGFLGITKSINASMLLISLFFMGVLIVSVFNDIFLSIWENRTSIGIFKLIGFTPHQLRMIMTWKTGILALVAMLLGFPLVLLLGPRLMGSVTAGFGVVDFPFVVSIPGSLFSMVFLLGAAVLSTLWASASIKQIRTQILVNE